MERPPERRRCRLPGYPYTAGTYFVTVCTQDSACLFGEMEGTELRMNAAGEMVRTWWTELPRKYAGLDAVDLVVLPNHLHGLLVLNVNCGPHLPGVMQWFKTMTTNEYFRGARDGRWRRVSGRVWQRGYYDHVVRDEDDLDRVQEYMHGNPLKWVVHRFNSGRFAG